MAEKLLSVRNFVMQCIRFYKAVDGYGHEERAKRYTIINNKVYLGENITVDSLRWELMQIEKPAFFLIDVAMRLWTPAKLANRALDMTKPIENIPSRSPVKQIESNKLRLLIKYDL
ncbi:uncharacterized protein LOC106641049 [Copidosoma floridanum]|uniref:uncharacterized protein LOC106641049 n=1 Tax=Copidosoma floridanum TaxID=29053 RepID=UPI000C6F61A8|nr:uncharacterized protein LOC106641049 [Copidosoma floridanum]